MEFSILPFFQRKKIEQKIFNFFSIFLHVFHELVASLFNCVIYFTGYVLDETTNECVARDACPCFYGGRSYDENEEMRKDCNTCTCSGGKWTCTENVCRGECSAYGATHISTFDGHYYKFGQVTLRHFSF